MLRLPVLRAPALFYLLLQLAILSLELLVEGGLAMSIDFRTQEGIFRRRDGIYVGSQDHGTVAVVNRIVSGSLFLQNVDSRRRSGAIEADFC